MLGGQLSGNYCVWFAEFYRINFLNYKICALFPTYLSDTRGDSCWIYDTVCQKQLEHQFFYPTSSLDLHPNIERTQLIQTSHSFLSSEPYSSKRHLYSSSAQLCAQTLFSLHHTEHIWHKGKADVDCRLLLSDRVSWLLVVLLLKTEVLTSSKHRKFTIWHGVTSQKTWILISETARPNFALSLHFRLCDKISYDTVKPFPSCVMDKESALVQLNFLSVVIQYL